MDRSYKHETYGSLTEKKTGKFVLKSSKIKRAQHNSNLWITHFLDKTCIKEDQTCIKENYTHENQFCSVICVIVSSLFFQLYPLEIDPMLYFNVWFENKWSNSTDKTEELIIQEI